MNDRSDPKPFHRVEKALESLFHDPNPDPAFLARLEQQFQTRQLPPAPAASKPSRFLPNLKRAARFVAWGVAALLLVLGLGWGIDRLIPRPLHGASLLPAPTEQSAPTPTETPVPEYPTPLSLQSPHEEIRQRILFPAWNSLWIEAQTTYTTTEGVLQNDFVQSWLQRTSGGRALVTDRLPPGIAFSLDLSPRWVWASNAIDLAVFDAQNPQANPKVVNPRWGVHPLEKANPVLEMLFPLELGLRSEDVQLVSMETIAGRPALMLDWSSYRLWVDVATGVLLRERKHSENGEVRETILRTILYNPEIPADVMSTENLEQARFGLASALANAHPTSTPGGPVITITSGQDQSVYIRSGPGTSYAVIGYLKSGEHAPALGKSLNGEWIQLEYPATEAGVGWVYRPLVELRGGEPPIVEPPPTPAPLPTSSGPFTTTYAILPLTLLKGSGDAMPPTQGPDQGMLYFVARSSGAPFSRELARVPVACLYTGENCVAEVVPGFPSNQDSPLSWSPDGRQAMLVDSNENLLRAYYPQINTWQPIVRDLYATRELLPWSPDGAWIAATIQQGENGVSNLVTLIRPDGSQQRPLAKYVGGDQTPLGWLNPNTLLIMVDRPVPKGQTGTQVPPRLYKLDIQNDESTELFQSLGPEVLHNQPIISPDGNQFITITRVGAYQELTVIDINGGQGRPLGIYGQDPVWSPDGQWIAVMVPQSFSSELTVVHPDGSGLRKLFKWENASLLWAPDSQHLIIQAWPPADISTGENRTRFFLVSIVDGSVKELTLTGTYTGYEPVWPSFQPPVAPDAPLPQLPPPLPTIAVPTTPITATYPSGIIVEQYPIGLGLATGDQMDYGYIPAPDQALVKRKPWRESSSGNAYTQQVLAQFGYRLENDNLYKGDQLLITGLQPAGSISVNSSQTDFVWGVTTSTAGGYSLVRKDSVGPWNPAPYLIPPVFIGDDLLELHTDPGGGNLQVMRAGQSIFTANLQTEPGGSVHGLWAWNGHWALELTGNVIVDGQSLNRQTGNDETYGFRLLDGKPFYIYRKGGQIDAWYEAHAIPLGFEQVIHYACCSGGYLTLKGNETMTWFYAYKDHVWYYVEIGVYP
jgi:Tol biopolymer transport system component